MIPLQTQEMFEELIKPINSLGKPAAKAVVVYFTASWCGACQRLNLEALQKQNTGVVWYKCDVDVNKYTLGYCGLTKIPSFVFIKDGKFLGKFTSSDNNMVSEMIADSF
jgi:thioredoxin-like negative regulator of GroEL